jgi:hypothetical protein
MSCNYDNGQSMSNSKDQGLFSIVFE